MTIAAFAWGTAPAVAQDPLAGARIVSLGGSVTETVFALGAGHLVVGVDESSIFPEGVTALPQVGYYRSLSTEGVLSLRPTLVVASEESGPEVVLAQLAAAGVRVVRVPERYDPEAAAHKVRTVAAALGREVEGARLVDGMERAFRELDAIRARTARRPRALFVWSRGGGSMVVGGGDTAAGAVLVLAGAENVSSGIRGYQPMNPEAIVAAAPEVLVVPRSTVEELGGLEAILALPGVGATPAGRARRIVTVDLLAVLGFGPRLGEELLRLAQALRPDPTGGRR